MTNKPLGPRAIKSTSSGIARSFTALGTFESSSQVCPAAPDFNRPLRCSTALRSLSLTNSPQGMISIRCMQEESCLTALETDQFRIATTSPQRTPEQWGSRLIVTLDESSTRLPPIHRPDAACRATTVRPTLPGRVVVPDEPETVVHRVGEPEWGLTFILKAQPQRRDQFHNGGGSQPRQAATAPLMNRLDRQRRQRVPARGGEKTWQAARDTVRWIIGSDR